MNDQLERNKTVIREFFELAFNRKEPEEAVAKYMGSYYRQHNPQAGDGPEPFIAWARGFFDTFPELRYELKRQIAEGDLVVQHGRLVRQPSDRGMAVIDIFRLEDGKMVEHWDVLQDVPETSANDNTMF